MRLPELALDDLVWPDGIVRIADSGFPIQFMEPNQEALEEMKITLCSVPSDVLDYALAVFGKGVGRGPVLHSVRYVDQIELMRPQVRRMTLRGGIDIQYGPSRRCGCGSRLRGYKPWGDARMVSDRKPPIPWVSAEVG